MSSETRKKLRNLLCGSRKECVFEVVIICLLVIFYENFTLWTKILFLLRMNMEVEYRMECCSLSSLGGVEFRGFIFFRKVCFMSLICNQRHKNT